MERGFNSYIGLCCIYSLFIWTTYAQQIDNLKSELHQIHADELKWQLEVRKSQIQNNNDYCEFVGINCNVLHGRRSGNRSSFSRFSIDSRDVALFDACNPRNQTVAIPRDPDSDISIWPTCTRALRCGGCCTSDVFSCEPTAIRERNLTIARYIVTENGGQPSHLDFVPVTIIEHLRCGPKCKVKEIHCNPLQYYQAEFCRCICTNQEMSDTCKGIKIWDDNECACICPNRATTFCPYPSRFNDHKCKCTFSDDVVQ